jgi:hypothetical protein
MPKPWRTTAEVFDLSSWSSSAWFLRDDGDEILPPYKARELEPPMPKHWTPERDAINSQGGLTGGSKVEAPEKTMIIFVVKQAIEDMILFMDKGIVTPDGKVHWSKFKNMSSDFKNSYPNDGEIYRLVKFFDGDILRIINAVGMEVPLKKLRDLVGLTTKDDQR